MFKNTFHGGLFRLFIFSSLFFRLQKQSIVTTIESPVFAEWAAGITPETPDRATVEKYILNMVDVSSHTFVQQNRYLTPPFY